MTIKQVEHISIQRIMDGQCAEVSDQVAIEEPLEIQLEYSTATGRMIKNIAVTMRTPGNDEELAAGFLFTEGIIQNAAAVSEIKQTDENRILVILKENIIPVLANAARNFYTTSSCGICGKASIEAIQTVSTVSHSEQDIVVKAPTLNSLQNKLKAAQHLFANTGGIHAAALFSTAGELTSLQEDVGRHNALDKLFGNAFLKYELPLNNTVLFLSGRASFELVQKAVMAGIRLIVAVGAPSSLAIELANEYNITLVGFLRQDRLNIYSGKHRIATE
jgi:FdhD protein